MAAVVEGKHLLLACLLALESLVYDVFDAVGCFRSWDDSFGLGEGSCGLENFVLVVGYRVDLAFVDEVG